MTLRVSPPLMLWKSFGLASALVAFAAASARADAPRARRGGVTVRTRQAEVHVPSRPVLPPEQGATAGLESSTVQSSVESFRVPAMGLPATFVAPKRDVTPVAKASSAKPIPSATLETTREHLEPSPDTEAEVSDTADVVEATESPPLSNSLSNSPGILLGARGGVVRRSLEFTQDVYGRMRQLKTNLYVYRVDAAVYPTFRASSLSGRFGLIAGFESAFAGNVRDADFGVHYDVSHTELFAGLRVRHPLQKHELVFDLTAGRLSSGLDAASSVSRTPDVSYTEARAALGGTLHFDRVLANGSAGFRVPLRYGEIADREWFPRVGGYGLEVSTLLEYLVSSDISVDAAVTLRRFVLEMNSQPEDGGEGISETAGGAVDMYLGAYLGMTFTL